MSADEPESTRRASSGLTGLLQHSPARDQVGGALTEYSRLMEHDAVTAARKRREYATAVNHFYDLVTDFYEYGWGPSFHFSTRYERESLREALVRFEHHIALRLGLGPGMRVLDLGCGVGGPMRTIARFSGASVTGINNNDYQVARSRELTRRMRLDHLCTTVKGDYMALDAADGSIDHCYAIEATCHAPSLENVYREAWRVLKPGGGFACIEWCTTASYDENNPKHRQLREAVILGNGLMDIPSIADVTAAAGRAGFTVESVEDLSDTAEIPWYEPLAPTGFSFASFRSSAAGRRLTNQLVGALEFLRIAPLGSRAVSTFLNNAADALVEIGRAKIFTPDLLVMMRKREC